MDYYKKSGNIKKYDEACKEYSLAKSQIELDTISVPLLDEESIREVTTEIDKNVAIILKWNSEIILLHFMHDSPLFPDFQEITKEATQSYNSSMAKTFSTTKFDINVNTKKLSDQEGLEDQIHKAFLINLGISLLPTFMKVVSNGVINGKLSYNHIYNFLKQHTWYGQDFPKMKMRANSLNDGFYNWLNLISPALHNFLLQIEASVLQGSNIINYNWILCTDSLTLKFEGALRDFIRLTGFNTSKGNNEEMREMLLEDLINSETAKKLFAENDLALFKLVFTNKGDNIRNNVAHCFYHSDNYSFDKICKVFFCILRLGKYRLKLSPEAVKE